ncbi:MAG: sigma-70 family RNA polymerase sigma factor [Planctomycetota bacterium]|nr:MAG: sigma-70 family RNA polymerase sigma factor [Planctomycetota bacterium]
MATQEALAGGRFPDTRWSLVLAGDRQLALEHLAAAYWRPVYGYVRARWARSEAEALDATQDFFLHLLEGELLSRADPGRGRFRAYVRAALGNFLTDEHRRNGAQSRGGGRRPLPIDCGGPDTLPDTRGQSPDAALDRLWRAELLARAAGELERELKAEGKDTWWLLFRDHFLSDDGFSHAQLAERHRITLVDVSNWLTRGRARYRDTLIKLVRDTVETKEALAAELDWLLQEKAP